MGRRASSGGRGTGIGKAQAKPSAPAKTTAAKTSTQTKTAPAKPPAKTPPAKMAARLVAKRPFFDQSERGNTLRLCHVTGTDFKFVTSWDQFITWTGSGWRRDSSGGGMLRMTARLLEDMKAEADALRKSVKDKDDKNAAKAKALYAWYMQSQSLAKRRATINGVHEKHGVDIDHDVLDADPWLLAVKNGVVDLRTGKCLPHERKYMMTKKLNISYSKSAKAPKWEAFLKDVLPDDDIRHFMQKYIGYSLTGQANERMFCILFGVGRNGKSVFLRTLQTMMGSYGISAAPGLLMSRQNEAHPAEVADLFGARLVVASEVKKGRAFDEEQLKRLTGNDIIKARRMNENWWQFEPTFKLLIAANHRPQVRDDSASFWDRLALIPFTTRIESAKDNKRLREQMEKTELPGILAWAVEGCLMWQKEGLVRPEAVLAATEDYRKTEDTIGKFFEERCRFDKDVPDKPRAYTMTSAELATAVKAFCDSNNMNYVFREKELADKLTEMGCRRTSLGPKDRRVRGWVGVQLLTWQNGRWMEPVARKDHQEEISPVGVAGAEEEPIKPGERGSDEPSPPENEVPAKNSVPPPAKRKPGRPASKPQAPSKPTKLSRIANSPGSAARPKPQAEDAVIADDAIPEGATKMKFDSEQAAEEAADDETDDPQAP